MKTPNLFSGRILPFTALLGAFEVLLLWYWVSLRLGQVLLYGAILAPFTAFAGKTALLAVSERRLVAKK
jgi:oligosaccharyltransferase complex subunit delta (ribophorin II)